MYRISICTVCMNRLSHLKETLPVNIVENMNYPDVEFVLLDYNSGDGLQDWIRFDMMPYINKGLLKYYRTDEPAYWNMSHARNMAANLSTGDIVCLVDADNYAGLGYARWINMVFGKNGTDLLVTTHQGTMLPYSDQAGKMAFHKSCFNAVRGFDESFDGYGMDDIDFVRRMERLGIVKEAIVDPEFLRCIKHSNVDRVCNSYLLKNLTGIYVAGSTRGNILDIRNSPQHYVLYLLKDNTFLEIVYEFYESRRHDVYFTGGWNINLDACKKGLYTAMPDGLLLEREGEAPVLYQRRNGEIYITARDIPRPVLASISLQEQEELFLTLAMAFSDCNNRLKFEANLKEHVVINPDGWGKGTACLNFGNERILAASA